MAIILCYKNYKIGKLEHLGNEYAYTALSDKDAFVYNYPFIQFSLSKVSTETSDEIPMFFEKFVDKVLLDPILCDKLNIDADKCNSFDILCKYAKLPQDKKTFYLTLA